MGVLTEFPITEAPAQEFSLVVDGRRLRFTLVYNETTKRFALDLAVSDETVLQGRRVVEGRDILAPFNLGLGSLFAAHPANPGVEPTLENFAAGQISLFHWK